MGASVGKNSWLVSEINITPFVDVMLVLFVICIVTAPMMTEGLEVNLPQTSTVETLPVETEHMLLTVLKDGKIYLNNYLVELHEIEQKLSELVTAQKKALFLQADKSVPYGIVVELMGRIRGAGIERLGVVAEKTDSSVEAKRE